MVHTRGAHSETFAVRCGVGEGSGGVGGGQRRQRAKGASADCSGWRWGVGWGAHWGLSGGCGEGGFGSLRVPRAILGSLGAVARDQARGGRTELAWDRDTSGKVKTVYIAKRVSGKRIADMAERSKASR